MGQDYDEHSEKYEYYQHLLDTEQVEEGLIPILQKVLEDRELSQEEQRLFDLFETEQRKDCMRCGNEVEWSTRTEEETELCDYCTHQAAKA